MILLMKYIATCLGSGWELAGMKNGVVTKTIILRMGVMIILKKGMVMLACIVRQYLQVSTFVIQTNQFITLGILSG